MNQMEMAAPAKNNAPTSSRTAARHRPAGLHCVSIIPALAPLPIHLHRTIVLWLLFFGLAAGLNAQPFHLPTANRALFEKDGEERFFVGTTGKPWPSGTFGCVRSEGWQFH